MCCTTYYVAVSCVSGDDDVCVFATVGSGHVRTHACPVFWRQCGAQLMMCHCCQKKSVILVRDKIPGVLLADSYCH